MKTTLQYIKNIEICCQKAVKNILPTDIIKTLLHYRSKSTETLLQIVAKQNFQQVYFSPGSVSLQSLNYRQYLTKKKSFLKFRASEVKATSFVVTSSMHLSDGVTGNNAF